MRVALLHLLTAACGTKRTYRYACYLSAFGGKADMSLTIAIYQNPALGAFFHELAGGSLLKDQHKSFFGAIAASEDFHTTSTSGTSRFIKFTEQRACA
jgi:hypothetical protein